MENAPARPGRRKDALAGVQVVQSTARGPTRDRTATSPICGESFSRIVLFAPRRFTPCRWSRPQPGRGELAGTRLTPPGYAGAPAVLDLVPSGSSGRRSHRVARTAVMPAARRPGRTSRLPASINGAPHDLDLPVLNRSRRIVWLVTGGDRRVCSRACSKSDDSIPAGRIRQDHAHGAVHSREAAARSGPRHHDADSSSNPMDKPYSTQRMLPRR